MERKYSRAFYNALDTMLLTEQGVTSTGGEDSFVRALGADAALIGVFDGCGGLGSRTYAGFDGHTAAYIASRTASGAVYDWFQALQDLPFPDTDTLLRSLHARLDRGFEIVSARGENALRVRGSMVRDFPTTAAIALAQEDGRQSLLLHVIWAGDSRVYLLDEDGLAQLTEDDLGGEDAMSNLSHDSALTNVLSSDGDYQLHYKCLRVTRPTVIFAATDGVFGYVQSPMEFEWLLLRVLGASESPELFEQRMKAILAEVAGDDFALCLMSFYFGSFDALRSAFSERARMLERRYVRPLRDDRTDAQRFWEEYRVGYERYLREADHG